MRIILVLSMVFLAACNMEVDVQINGEKNEELAQSWMDHLLISGDLDAASDLMHEDFTFMWMGIVYPGSEIHEKESFFDNYWPVVGELLPNGIVLTTIDAISDNDGVALIQFGDAEGINGEYDNKYVWIFKMKDGLIHSVREYNSDLLVATRLFKNELKPVD